MSDIWSKTLTGADDVPLGQPVLRFSDLNENSTRYDYLAAAPSDDDLVKMWIAIGTTSVVVSVWVGIIFSGIACSRKARALTFNLYLLFLMVPDFLMSFLCAIACFLAVSAGHWYSPFMCHFQSWFIVFGIGGNSWMTVVILRQIHKMLCNARRCIRYTNPTRKQVCIQSGIALLWATFLGIWAVLPTSWNIPIRTYPQQGYACVPIEYNFPSSLFYFLVFFPCLSGIPLIYTTYVIFDVWRKSLLPKRGQRRVFAVYMMRIILCMYCWWLPSIMFKYFIPSAVGPWGKCFFSIWMHLQGIASSGLMLGKPDINKGVKNLVTCRADPCVACCGTPRDGMPKRQSSIKFASGDYGWGSRFASSITSSFRSLKSGDSIPSLRSLSSIKKKGSSQSMSMGSIMNENSHNTASLAFHSSGVDAATDTPRDEDDGVEDNHESQVRFRIDDEGDDYGFSTVSPADEEEKQDKINQGKDENDDEEMGGHQNEPPPPPTDARENQDKNNEGKDESTDEEMEENQNEPPPPARE
mmetsp:Transcript_31671/g.64435  ORF Transcript_31671/g.64435 Transcript_31671/m.64435 type:complete len:525 (+) Transcript_31671:325-1899(+)